MKTNFSGIDVIDLYARLEEHGIKIWLDGGWGVDALLGEQTRPHSDVDIVIQHKDRPALREFLAARGYQGVIRADTRAWNFVLGDVNGHLVDVHVILLNDVGDGLYGPIEKGDLYPAGSLAGTGTIAGIPVRCIAPEYLVRFHTGYPLRDSDFHDVLALCQRFGLELPAEYVGLAPEG